MKSTNRSLRLLQLQWLGLDSTRRLCRVCVSLKHLDCASSSLLRLPAVQEGRSSLLVEDYHSVSEVCKLIASVRRGMLRLPEISREWGNAQPCSCEKVRERLKTSYAEIWPMSLLAGPSIQCWQFQAFHVLSSGAAQGSFHFRISGRRVIRWPGDPLESSAWNRSKCQSSAAK